jgi:hypothetical protein
MITGIVEVTAALGSGLAAAGSSVLQHRVAHAAPDGQDPGSGSLRRVLLRPLWIAGLLVAALGLALHTLALDRGQLMVVQPLLVSGVVFALPVSKALDGRRISAAEIAWSCVLITGLASFLVAGNAHGGQVSVDADALAVATIVASAVALGAAAAGRWWSRRYAALLLAVSAGVGYGVTAALLKEALAVAQQGVVAELSDWPMYALLVVGGASLLLTQLAYRAGPLSQSLPALSITDPAVSIAVGALAFREQFAHGLSPVTVEVLGFTLMLVATARLARLNHAVESRQDPADA